MSPIMMFFQVNLDPDGLTKTIEFCAHSLENSRVCPGSFDTFHIFYHLVYGAPEQLKRELGCLDCFFTVSLDSNLSYNSDHKLQF